MSKTTEVIIKWDSEDVKHLSEEFDYNPKLSDDEIGDILDIVQDTYDCTMGVTYDTIKSAIQEIVSKRRTKRRKIEWYEVGVEKVCDIHGSFTESVFQDESLTDCIGYVQEYLLQIFKDNYIYRKIFIDSWYKDENNTPMPLKTVMLIDLDPKK